MFYRTCKDNGMCVLDNQSHIGKETPSSQYMVCFYKYLVNNRNILRFNGTVTNLICIDMIGSRFGNVYDHFSDFF